MALPSGAMAITGAGMVSSLGATVAGACAAARARLTRPTRSDYAVMDSSTSELVPVSVHAAGRLTLGFAELGRWVRLGSLALRSLLQHVPLDAASLAKTALLVNLPSGFLLRSAHQQREKRAPQQGKPPPPEERIPYEALEPWYRAEYVRKLLRAVDVQALPAVQEIVFGDQAGILAVLGRAAELLRTGRVTRCLVGGVDCLLEPQWMEAANELRVLKTATRPIGFMPGEGAAFLLLEEAGRALRAERPILATVQGMASGKDEAHRFASPPPNGYALSQVIKTSLEQAPGPCTGFYCDLNGDVVRSQEWGLALVHLQPDCMPDWTVVPAESFGETRAAYGFIAACMATQAFAGGYHPSDTLLVWAASDSGARGSFTVTRCPSRRIR